MKLLSLSTVAIAMVSILPSLTSCSSDRNPFDMSMSVEKETALIRLNLNVASTRAEGDLATAEEKAVSYVSVFVFDDSNELEVVKSDLKVSSGAETESIEVKSGLKTIYAVSGKSVIGASTAIGTPLATFEATLFDSKISDLKTSSGFVMVGKSDPQVVMKSANAESIPQSNVFNIELERLLAKTQVKCGNLDVSSLGFKISGVPRFRVSQTCNKMRLKSNGKNIFDSFTGTSSGTYQEYTVTPNTDYSWAVQGDFKAEECQYLTENIVENPVAGNTTFVTLLLTLIPDKYYIYDYSGTLKKSDVTPTDGSSFVAVGIVDATNGFEDFAIDPETKHIIVFQTPAEADKYVNALNGGSASAMTVSESETPLGIAPATRAGGDNHKFQSITFTGGQAYYRINIKHSDGTVKVERNNFYKITVNSVKNLGFHDESLLRPLNPETSLENSSSAWVEAVFIVAPWDQVEQDVDL